MSRTVHGFLLANGNINRMTGYMWIPKTRRASSHILIAIGLWFGFKVEDLMDPAFRFVNYSDGKAFLWMLENLSTEPETFFEKSETQDPNWPK